MLGIKPESIRGRTSIPIGPSIEVRPLFIHLENGTLCEILGCNVTTWIPVDVRLKTKYEWNFYPVATPYANVTKLYYRN